MNALDFIVALHARGVTFLVVGDRLRVRDPQHAVTDGERALISALKPSIRALILTELPPERADEACAAFEAHPGVAICRDCGFNLPAHFWRLRTCTFFAGNPRLSNKCGRCGAPWPEHIEMGATS